MVIAPATRSLWPGRSKPTDYDERDAVFDQVMPI
jgi:hypothetical protein